MALDLVLFPRLYTECGERAIQCRALEALAEEPGLELPQRVAVDDLQLEDALEQRPQVLQLGSVELAHAAAQVVRRRRQAL